MDLSLKQRLVGAAVLIAVVVIFVPMFMSSSPPKKTGEMETSTLAIPPSPSDHDLQTRVLPVDSSQSGMGMQPSTAMGGDGQIATVDTASAPKPESESASTATPATPESATSSMATSGPASTATPAASTKPEPTPPGAKTKTKNSKNAAKSAAATPATEEPKPAPGQAANKRFFVNLTAYDASSTKHADDLAAHLKKDGFPAFTEATTYQGKQATRVRVGPFDSRAAAESARLRIKQARPNVPSSVSQTAEDAKAEAPAAAPPVGTGGEHHQEGKAAAAAPPPAHAGGWAVQVSAASSVEAANKLRDRLKGAGFAAFVDKANKDGTTFWRVRAGPEVDRAAADKLRASIKDKLKLDGVLVPQP